MAFECVNCGNNCNECCKKEGKRNIREDRCPDGSFGRIPWYMIYEKYGYPKYVKPTQK